MSLPRVLLLAALCFNTTALSGCYYLSGQYAIDQENAKLAKFVGTDSKFLLKNLGAPNQIMDNGKGGKIWIYRTTEEKVHAGRTETSVNQKNGTATTYSYPGSVEHHTLEELFFIDKNGRVYDTGWNKK